MNGVQKILPQHRKKLAFVYARQSTPAQVLQHRSSTERQLDLTHLANELGWPPTQVELIDEDLGRSGKFADNRAGFQRLAAEVSLGHVGAVFSLDASRLARSSADWHRLLEIAALTKTLIVDEQTVYEPGDPNDRLVLGMKGTMADFELVWLRQRMDGGRWHMARKGEYRIRPPAGYIYEDADSRQLTLDPDEEVRRAVALLFERYKIAGTLSDVLRYFSANGLKFPSRVSHTRVVWKPPTLSRIHVALLNPFYTGTYVFGRTKAEMVMNGGRRQRVRRLPIEDWPVVIHGAHPAYISWEDYLANRKKIAESGPNRKTRDGRGAVREGHALLQGLLHCDHCSYRLHVRYSGQDGKYPTYSCTGGGRRGVELGQWCQIVYARNLDAPIVELVLSVLTKDEVERATRVVEIVEQQDAALEQQWKLRLERARYETTRAERQYDACDPENRVVARTLETRWNEKLTELERLEREYEESKRSQRFELSDLDRQRILGLADDLPKLWNAPTTTDRDRKLLLRMLIKEISVRSVDVPRPAVRVRVLWHTSAVTEFEAERPGKGAHGRKIAWRVLSTSVPKLPNAGAPKQATP